MEPKMDWKRTGIYLAFAFGIAWITGLVIYLTGGLQNSPQLAPGVSLAVILLATFYMWAPALGNIFTRLITREGFKDTGLRPNFRQGWRLWVAAWFLSGLMTIAGGVIFFALFPQYFDSALTNLQAQMNATGKTGGISPWMIVAIQTGIALLLSPVLNIIATFGEEFGWRAYLLPKLLPLGEKRAVLVSGIIWGVWHWPVIFMGYEYGFKYPGAPVVGPLLFIWITILFATFLSWVTLRSGSIWPAAIGHAAINGIAALAALFVIGEPNPLLGPLPVGLIGSLGYAALALIIFLSPVALRSRQDGRFPQPVLEPAPASQPAD